MKKFYTVLFICLLTSIASIKAQEWTEVTKALPRPEKLAATNYFGLSVSVDGNYMVVGSYGYDQSKGRALVFGKNGDDWDTIAILTAADGAASDYFGYSVSISGETIVVGAYGDDDKGSYSGSAYIYEKPTTGWADMTQTAKITASDGAASDYFGYSVSISGETVVVGAYYDDDNGSASGSAYIYEKPTTGWADMTQTAKITASDGAASDYFGYSVSISSETVVVGAFQDDDNGSSSGSAYVFEKPTTGWADMTQTAKITVSDGAAYDYFGCSLGISGDTVVVGAYGDDDNGSSSGSAYIYEKPTAGWADMTQTAKITASDGAAYDYFGYSVSISGETVVVGAIYDNDNGSASGSAYIYEKPSTGWADMTQTAKITASDGEAYDYFGYSVSISGETVVVGAYLDDDNGSSSGSAYVFEKPSTSWSNTTEDQKIQNPVELNNLTNYFGYSVSVDSSFAVIGCYGYNNYQGCAYVLSNNETEWDTVARLTPSDGAADDYFGYSVSISGNTVVVGAYNDNIKGSAYIFEKPSAGWTDMTQTAKITASDRAASDYFGYSVSISGETVVVGAYLDDDNGSSSGSAYVFEKPSTGWTDMTQTAKITASDGAEYNYFGRSVSILDETVVVGAHGDGDNGSSSGSAYVFEKPTTGWTDMTQTAKINASDGADYDYFGNSVSISDNMVVVGAYMDDDNGSSSGSAYIYEKPSTGWANMTQTAKITASDGAAEDYFGYSVSISGRNAIVGAYQDDDNGTSTGAAYFYYKPYSPVTILSEPEDVNSICSQSIASFGITDTNALSYQWQVSSNAGSSYSNLEDNTIYAGTTTDTLTVIAGAGINHYWYRCIAYNPDHADTSNYAVLTLDNIAPVITSSHVNDSLCADNNNEITLPDYTGDITATDNCSSEFTFAQLPEAGTTSTAYSTLVRLIAFDEFENSDTVSFYVIMLDTIAPVISSSPESMTAYKNESCEIILADYTGEVTATDNLDTELTLIQSPVAGTTISDETTLVTITVSDDAGNSSEVSFNVTASDTISPVITASPDSKTLYKGTDCNITLPDYTGEVTATDNCDAELTYVQSPVAGTTVSDETMLVTITVSDGAGNSSEASFNVTASDTISPAITCVSDQSFDLGSGETVYTISGTGYDATATDNCGVSSIVNDFNNTESLEGAELSAGTTTIVWTVEDEAGNTANCSCDITVNAASTGINTTQGENITIYPNPVSDALVINLTGNEDVIPYKIVSLTGKTLANGEIDNGSASIDMSQYEAGVYFIQLLQDNKAFNYKIVKE